MTDIFSLRSSAVPESAKLVCFRGSEVLCRPYEFEVHFLLVDEPDFDMADAIGGKATIIANREDGRPAFHIHGIISSLSLVHELLGRALYRAALVPNVWLLSQTRRSNIFTKMKPPDIIKAVLEDGGLSSDQFRLDLDADYAEEEHVCQYHESHLDFVHRWLELLGMYYYFEQAEDQEILVITDNKSFHDKLVDETIRYFPTNVASTAGEHFDSVLCQHVALPGGVRLADYDYLKPSLEMVKKAEVSSGLGEVSIHGSRFFTPGQGDKMVLVRSEELKARQIVFHATGNSLGVRAGYVFQVEDHPRESFNKPLLATEVRYFGNQSSSTEEMKKLVKLEYEDVYRVEVSAIPADVQYRAPRATAWPRVHGFENGVVDGEATSEYAQLDDQGRYLVRFNFDESGLKDGKASTWVRMMQPHGGEIEGFHFPLRKGTEVLLAFLGGDVDRPVITGVAPNAHRPSPVTSANHTMNIVKTGGRNTMKFQDLEGKQYVNLYTPTLDTEIHMGDPANWGAMGEAGADVMASLGIRTGGNCALRVGGEWWIDIGKLKDEHVAGTVNLLYDQTEKHHVKGKVTEEFDDKLMTTIGKGRHEVVSAGGVLQEIKGGWTQDVSPGGKQHIKGGYEHITDATCKETYKMQTTTATDGWTLDAKGVTWTIGANGVTVTAPTITFKTPSFDAGGAKESWFASNVKKFFLLDWEGATIKNEAIGLSRGIVGLKYEYNGVCCAAIGLKMETVGLQKVNEGIDLDDKGLDLKKAGLKFITAGLCSIQ